MIMKTRASSIVLTVVMLVVTAASCVSAKVSNTETVTLNAAMDKPVMLAGEKQTAYIRISLEGLPIELQRDRMPVNIALVIDKSGSMSGSKIEHAKNAAIAAINKLNSNDILSVITYDTNAKVILPSTKLTDKESIISQIRAIRADGNTALYGGVSKGGDELKKFIDKEHVNRMILLSDGLANVGPSSPADLESLGHKLANNGISVTTIGLGLGYNEDLMTKLAFKSDGNHYFVENADGLASVFDREFGNTMSVVAQDIRAELICAEGVRPVRILGRIGEIEGQAVRVSINQLYSKNEKYFILEVEVPTSEAGTKRRIADVTIRYNPLNSKAICTVNSHLDVNFSDSAKLVEKNTNQKVMVDVVEQIAIERNELAVVLRDKGEVKKAEKLLRSNAAYLGTNATKYSSTKLKDYSAENNVDADNLAPSKWGRQRKSMRYEQTSRKSQQ